ncbi:MAG TPA: phosphotransferase [Roseiflexaceae bacterium]|nr:phosphotransferase [Roseiflexaceae bacterium]
MSSHAVISATEREQIVAQALRRLATRPDWLDAALQAEQVLPALARQIPEVASGALRLVGLDEPRLFLKNTNGRWRGVYALTVEGLPGAAQQIVPIRVQLTAPGLPLPKAAQQPAAGSFGKEGWRCYLPELRMLCEYEPPEQALEILPQLTDPVEARDLLERSIRACSRAYRDLRIRACRPEVLNYKPGSRCTLRYHLKYDVADADQGWPATVIAKVYRAHKGQQAYEGMAELWGSPLSRSAAVRISEPLAYVPKLKLLVQAPLAEEQTLEEFLRSTLRAGTPAAWARLERFVRTAAIGLAELHLSGARAEATRVWDERITEIPEQLERIAVVAPELVEALTPLFEHMQAFAAAHPAEPLVPSHGSFDSDQVLIGGEEISFIDFDNFCMAEPALDVSHFRAAIMDSGMKLIDERTLRDPVACRAYLQRLDALGALFLAQYEALAPVSRQRLALWDALDYLRDCLHIWTKPKPSGAEAVVRILEYHLPVLGMSA